VSGKLYVSRCILTNLLLLYEQDNLVHKINNQNMADCKQVEVIKIWIFLLICCSLVVKAHG